MQEAPFACVGLLQTKSKKYGQSSQLFSPPDVFACRVRSRACRASQAVAQEDKIKLLVPQSSDHSLTSLCSLGSSTLEAHACFSFFSSKGNQKNSMGPGDLLKERGCSWSCGSRPGGPWLRLEAPGGAHPGRATQGAPMLAAARQRSRARWKGSPGPSSLTLAPASSTRGIFFHTAGLLFSLPETFASSCQTTEPSNTCNEAKPRVFQGKDQRVTESTEELAVAGQGQALVAGAAPLAHGCHARDQGPKAHVPLAGWLCLSLLGPAGVWSAIPGNLISTPERCRPVPWRAPGRQDQDALGCAFIPLILDWVSTLSARQGGRFQEAKPFHPDLSGGTSFQGLVKRSFLEHTDGRGRSIHLRKIFGSPHVLGLSLAPVSQPGLLKYPNLHGFS
ncbi:hypothetical protein EYD10_16008 [Varanus komodoensis]|nr:hypothetical protein EYD10_16008 [Varanus komodoensis]